MTPAAFGPARRQTSAGADTAPSGPDPAPGRLASRAGRACNWRCMFCTGLVASHQHLAFDAGIEGPGGLSTRGVASSATAIVDHLEILVLPALGFVRWLMGKKHAVVHHRRSGPLKPARSGNDPRHKDHGIGKIKLLWAVFSRLPFRLGDGLQFVDLE